MNAAEEHKLQDKAEVSLQPGFNVKKKSSVGFQSKSPNKVFPLITFFFVDSFIFLMKFILTNDDILATFRINDQEVIVNPLKLNHKKLPEIFSFLIMKCLLKL